MEKQTERKDEGLTLPKDTQINLVMNNPDPEEDTIDLGRVFRRFKEKTRIFVWLLLGCLVAGIGAGILFYQINKKPLTVSSVVTLRYYVEEAVNEEKEVVERHRATDLTAPDGVTQLDLNQISSSYVLRNALSNIELSKDISLSALQEQITIQRIPTEESRREQEMINSMLENNSTAGQAYARAQDFEIEYGNRFIVSLTNGFGDEKSVKIYLEDEELRALLDRILFAYNDYLVKNYGLLAVPSDEISIIDINSLDTIESLRLLRDAMKNLTAFCEEQKEEIRTYRSWKSGATLEELERRAELVQDVSLDYLYTHVYNNGLVREPESMLTLYQYELRNAESELNRVNENITAVQQILNTYKNDEIYVTTQESDAAKYTNHTTDYYNELVLSQTENYKKAAELKLTISELQGLIANLKAAGDPGKAEDVSGELQKVFTVCEGIYKEISDHIAEILESPFYRKFTEASVAQGKTESFITGSMKNMIMFGAVGAVLALALWFFSALAPEFRHGDEEEEKQKKPEDPEEGKGAAEV